MCQHICKCGKTWSHQDFGIPITANITCYEPCPFNDGQKLYAPNGRLVYEHTEVCPYCYAEQQHKRNIDALVQNWAVGIQRSNPELTFEEAQQRAAAVAASKGFTNGRKQKDMNNEQRRGALDAKRIIELQLDEEATFKLLVANMDEQQLEQHYTDLLEKMEMFRVRALRYRQLKTDWDIEQLCKVSDEDRAAFEESKAKRAAARKTPNVTAIRQSKQEKMITSFADRILTGNPTMTREEAIERAKRMFA